MRFLLVTMLVLIGSASPCWGKKAAELQRLSEGQRVKVEGKKFEGKKLIAEKVEVRKDDDEFEVEGPISRIDRSAGTFMIGVVGIAVDEGTKFVDRSGEPRSFSDLNEGLRVKIKAKRMRGKLVQARTVSLEGASGDTDFEIEAPIKSVNHGESELLLPLLKVKVTSKTSYLNLPNNGAEAPGDELPSSRIRRDDDEQRLDPIRVGPIYLGGKLSITDEQTNNMDLDAENPDKNDWVRPEAELELSSPLGEYSEAYARLSFNRQVDFGDERTGARPDFNVREAFLYVGNFLHPALSLQVGRQRFRDRREWLYDDQLDSVRLHFKRSKFKAEASAAKGLFGPTGSRSDQLYLIGSAEYRFPGRRYLGGHIIKRNDLTSRDEDPIWFGLNSRGRVTGSLDYWTEFSRMMGRREKHLLRGYAYDGGLSVRFPLPLQPTLAAGYAFGSGDNDQSDGVDGNFRQTRLNDNSYRYNGLKRYRYYGVLSEPELFNLRIATADLGIRSGNWWSLNLIYHTYRQAVPFKKIGDMRLTLRPRGRDARLGQEYDLVLAFRKAGIFDLNIVSAVYLPGPAYDGSRPRSYLFRPELRFYF